VASALDYAHRRNVLHRDIKPANILLATDPEFDEERVYLGDFGISKVVDESRPLTEDGQLLLTIDFASPEQIEGRALDARSDIYSLGATFYALLTGSTPFPAESFLAKANMHLQHQPPRPSSLVPGLPIGFDRVIARAMAKNPDDRYRTCRELAADARTALAQPSPTAPQPTDPEATTAAETDKLPGAGTIPGTPTRLRPTGKSDSTARPTAGRFRSFILTGHWWR
jgi:serine/threonine protein kinase